MVADKQLAPPVGPSGHDPAALATFRAKLVEASPDVDAQLTASGEEGLTSRTLTRWLVARKGDVDRAVKDLTEHLAWRVRTVPGGHIPEEAVRSELAQDKAFVLGFDQDGHPTLLARVSKHRIAQNHDDFVSLMVYVLDLAVAMGLQEEKRSGRVWDGKVVGILDLTNITLANCDSAGLLTIFKLLQNHYVERLHKMYLYAAPTIFSAVWSVVRPFVDPVTRQKVQFLTAKDAAAVLAASYAPDVLPPELGGTATARPAAAVRRELLKAAGVAGSDDQDDEAVPAVPT